MAPERARAIHFTVSEPQGQYSDCPCAGRLLTEQSPLLILGCSSIDPGSRVLLYFIFCTIIFIFTQGHTYWFYLFNFFCFLKIYCIDYAITVAHFPHSFLSALYASSHPHSPRPFSSCPCILHISSLYSLFPILFLTSPCLFSTYHLCFLFSVPFSLSPPPTPLLITLHVISISVILFLF